MRLTDEQIETRIDKLEALIDAAEYGTDKWATLCAEQAELWDEQTFRHRASPDYIEHKMGRIPDRFID